MKPTYEELELRVKQLTLCCDTMTAVNAAFVAELDALRRIALGISDTND